MFQWKLLRQFQAAVPRHVYALIHLPLSAQRVTKGTWSCWHRTDVSDVSPQPNTRPFWAFTQLPLAPAAPSVCSGNLYLFLFHRAEQKGKKEIPFSGEIPQQSVGQKVFFQPFQSPLWSRKDVTSAQAAVPWS